MRSLKNKVLRRFARYCVLVIQRLRIIFFYLASMGTRISGRPNRQQPVYCIGRGAIIFGGNFQAGYFPAPGFINTYCHLNARGETSTIRFGRDVIVNNGFSAITEVGNISIGDRVLIGQMVSIFESDFHGLQIADRGNSAAVLRADVTIGDDVFVGANVIILKGVTIGNGAVIAAGSVVTRDIPANTIAAGNPARVIRQL